MTAAPDRLDSRPHLAKAWALAPGKEVSDAIDSYLAFLDEVEKGDGGNLKLNKERITKIRPQIQAIRKPN